MSTKNAVLKDTRFFKYQSLGNDFIILDWYEKKESEILTILNTQHWNQFVIDSTNRHFGIGADGVLILKKNPPDNTPECLIFNSDGTPGQLCLNGIRCITKHLYSHHNFPQDFEIKMGAKIIQCSINKNKIINKIEKAHYLGTKTIKILDNNFTGHVVNIGNPHFIIFQKTNLNWLKQYGHQIESHKSFENKTNVEFVWQDLISCFNVLVYERGCGITLACSSGAAAITSTIYYLNKIKNNESISIKMPGGKMRCWLNNNKIALQAESNLVFTGSFSIQNP